MTEPSSSLLAVGFIVVVLAHAALALWLRGGARRLPNAPRPRQLLLGALWTTAAWGAAGVLDLGSTQRWTWHLALGLDALRFALWCALLAWLSVGSPRAPAAGRPARRSTRWPWVGTGLLLGASLGVNALVGVLPPDVPWGARAIGWTQLGWAVFALLLVEQLYRLQPQAARWGVKALCVTVGGLCVFDIYLLAQVLMFGAVSLDASDARPLVHGLAVPLLWTAARRAQLSKPPALQLSSAAVFYSASLLLVGLYLLFVAAAGYWVRLAGGTWGGALQVSLAFAALAALGMLATSGEVRARLRVLLAKNFLQYRYDYRVEWLRFTALMSRGEEAEQPAGDRIVRGLADLVEATGGSLWLRGVGESGFTPRVRLNLPECDVTVAEDDPFAVALREREWVFDLHHPVVAEGAPPADALPEWLKALPGARLALPLLVGRDLIGFVVLGQTRAPIELNWEVRDLLKTAGRQAAAFLAQLQVAEALLEARKFDAFNRMSAFVVHDLKNIVTQLSLMLKNAQRHRANPEFQQDMLATVESSLDKMRQMMLQLREGARPPGGAVGVDLAPLLERIRLAARQRGRDVSVEAPAHLSTRGHIERLERVIGHLVQNALDATPAQGHVWVRAWQDAGRVRVEVGDTGSGMTPEFIRTRLFRPFASTKTSGMGIGSFESMQYVKELGGSLEVDSAPGQGTRITMLLPLLVAHAPSDLTLTAAS